MDELRRRGNREAVLRAPPLAIKNCTPMSTDPFNSNLGPSFSADPQVNLKGGGVPWPVYLAVGLAVVAGGAFLGIKVMQTQKNRKVHAEFMTRFQDFEKDEVGGFWRCLFGKEGDGRRFSVPEQFANTLDGALMIDPKGFPDKVRDECVPKLSRVAGKMRDLNAPLEYTDAMEKYNKALLGMTNALSAWAENAPKRAKARGEQKVVEDGGGTWAAGGNPRKPEAGALVYDKFLRCAVPNVDKMKDAEELLGYFASRCLNNSTKGWKVDREFVGKLRETCIPEANGAGSGKPGPTFAALQSKMGAEQERIAGAVGKCFTEAARGARQDDVAGLGKTWLETFNAGSEIRKLGASILKSE